MVGLVAVAFVGGACLAGVANVLAVAKLGGPKPGVAEDLLGVGWELAADE